jgi:hypothetical protein
MKRETTITGRFTFPNEPIFPRTTITFDDSEFVRDIHAARAALEGISRKKAKRRNFFALYGGGVAAIEKRIFEHYARPTLFARLRRRLRMAFDRTYDPAWHPAGLVVKFSGFDWNHTHKLKPTGAAANDKVLAARLGERDRE